MISRYWRTLLLSAFLLPPLTSPDAAEAQTPAQHVRFTENRGQVVDMDGHRRPDILYVASGPGVRVYFRTTGISYVFTKVEGRADPQEFLKTPYVPPFLRDTAVTLKLHRIDVEFVGASRTAVATGEERSSDYVNFYLPQCPDGITGVASYGRITYHDLYPNIDLVFYSNEQGLKYDFVVRPGGRVSDIRLRYIGADTLGATSEGTVHVGTSLGSLEEGAPRTYQTDENAEQPITSRYHLHNDELSFAIADYDHSQPLVIDPLLLWSTYYGGSNIEYAWGGGGGSWGGTQVADIDRSGNLLVTGTTLSTDFPVSTGAFQTTSGGSYDAYIIKMTSQGGRVWATYFGGGGGYDWGGGIVNDALNNIYISGTTNSANLPVTSGAFQTTYGGGSYDIFIARFDSNGTRNWATYYGGNNQEWGGGLALDSTGYLIVSGGALSPGLATTGAFQTTITGNDDALMAKFSTAGARQWATYFGGTGSENYSNDVCVDPNNNIILVGGTSSSNLPVTTGAYQTSLAGVYDEYIAKFNSNGGRLWVTFFGGTGAEYGSGVTTDLDSNIIISGYTASTNLPTTSGAFQTSLGGGTFDGFVAKFTAAGGLRWSTYCGGNHYDWVPSIAADLNRSIVLSGYSYSSNFPVTSNAYQGTLGGQCDAVVLKLDSSGQSIWSTYLGGTNYDWSYGLAVDRNAIYVIGSTLSNDFPITSGAFQSTNSGNYDLFISKFCDILPEVTVTGPTTICPGDSIVLSAPPGYDSYRWSNNATTRSITVKQGGDYFVTASLAACSGTSDTIHVTLYRTTPPVIAHGSTTFCPGDSVVLTIPAVYRSQRWSTNATGNRIVVRDSGQYFVEVIDTNGCRTISDTVTVRINPRPAPTITILGNKALCEGDTVELDAGAGYRLYLWRPGNQTTRTIRVTKGGVYTVQIENEFYCTGTSPPVTVSVNPKPDSTITAIRPRVFCAGDSTILSGPAGMASYRWMRNDSTIGTARVLMTRADGKVTLVVTDTNGCRASSSALVQVEQPPVLKISTIGPTTFCQGDSVVLDAGPFYQNYKWSTGETNQRIIVRQSGRYWVTFQSSVGCPGASDTITITASPRPSATIAGPVSVCANSKPTYAVTARPGLTYRWRVTGSGSLQGSSAGSEAMVQWGASGTGTVRVEVTDQATGCSAVQEITVTVGTGIQPAIVGPDRICPDSTAELDAGPGYASYNWSTGESTRKIVVTKAGVYTVTVADAAGCSGTSAPFVVSQSPAPEPTITMNGPQVLCSGSTIELDAGEFATYTWSSGERTRRITVSTAGTYTVTVTDSLGCQGTSAPITVVEQPAPAPQIDGANSVCVNTTKSYSVADVAGDIYQWSVSSEGTIVGPSNGASIQIRWSANGTGTIDLTQTSGATGCAGKAQQMLVDVGNQLKPTVTPSGPLSICDGDSVVLTAPAGYDSYAWSTGEKTRSITVRAADSYSVQVSDAEGVCTGVSAPVEVSVQPRPVVGITPAGMLRLCPGDSAVLTADAGFTDYQWSNGMRTRQITVHDAGDYGVTAANGNGCKGSSQMVHVVVNAAPVAPTITVSGDTLTASPALTYQWFFEGNPIPGATSQQYVTSAFGSYSVVVTDTNGCRAASQATLLDVLAVSTVMFGEYEATPGDHIRIPLQLTQSQKLDEAHAYDYLTRVRFFKRLLYPTGATPHGVEDGDYRVITMTGRRGDGQQQGEIGTLELVAALGDTLETPLEIEEFIWQNGTVKVITRNGRVTVRPQGGWDRYRSAGRLTLLAPRPNPAFGMVELTYETIEPGRTQLYITDMLGERTLTLIDADLPPGRDRLYFDSVLLASGSYYVILQTPTGRAIQPMEVEH